MTSLREFWIDLFKFTLKYPKAFFRQITKENWQTLGRALKNEPLSQILKNAKALLIRTNKDLITVAEVKTKKFLQKLTYDTKIQTIICITHETTLTGAPLIILNIGKNIAQRGLYSVVFILCKGGELRNEFKKVAPSYDLEFYHNNGFLKKELEILINGINSKSKIEAVFFNSEGATRLLPYFYKKNIKNLISLIHEMGNYYPQNAWNHVNRYSNYIIFPCNYVAQLAQENSDFDSYKCKIIGQGLLKKQLLLKQKNTSKVKLYKELGIESSSKIILGCGALTPRKGIDLFVLIAINTLRNLTNSSNVIFLWLGGGEFNEHQIWIERDIIASGFQSNIKFIGKRKNTTDYFVGADLFLMSSRGDPFPCVVHEALAAGLPVIGFENSGGVAEMLPENGGGMIFPYADIIGASKGIKKYIEDSTYLSNQGEFARQYAMTELDFAKYVDKILQII